MKPSTTSGQARLPNNDSGGLIGGRDELAGRVEQPSGLTGGGDTTSTSTMGGDSSETSGGGSGMIGGGDTNFKSHAKSCGSILPESVQNIVPEKIERMVPNAIHDTGDKKVFEK